MQKPISSKHIDNGDYHEIKEWYNARERMISALELASDRARQNINAWPDWQKELAGIPVEKNEEDEYIYRLGCNYEYNE